MLWSGLFTATEASLGAFHLVLGWPLITALVFITIGPAILAYRFWGAGVRRSSPAVGGFFANLIPLFTAILSVLVLGASTPAVPRRCVCLDRRRHFGGLAPLKRS